MKRRSKEVIDNDKAQREAQRKTAAAQPKPVAAHPVLAAAVGQLARSLDDARRSNPCFKAWKLLRSDQPDQSDVLSQEAESVFRDLELESPDDPLIWHHLAIIRHGRAIDRHLNQGACDKNLWNEGLQAWAKVIASQGFWDKLRERWHSRLARKPHDMLLQRLLNVDLGAIRAQLPGQLLRLHYDLILEFLEAKKRSHANCHFQVLSAAPFDSSLIETLKANLYRMIVGDTTALCKQDQFDAARRRVENYLSLDANNVKALVASVRTACAEGEKLLLGGDCADAAAAIERSYLHAQNPALVAAIRRTDFTLELKSLQQFYFIGSIAGVRGAAELGTTNPNRADELYSNSANYCKQAKALGGDAREFGEICVDTVIRKLRAGDYVTALQIAERSKRFTSGDSVLEKLSELCREVIKGNQKALRILEDLLAAG